ncbi:MAG TPA: efflux transporter outer membrane subunit [Terracidiphilus sp.]|jgi:NodT family efflux transporter outer membrane factor (OMF) lipoprotein|nr:efflux transporter outer membrane subunit [Terracidiphilus sp.]
MRLRHAEKKLDRAVGRDFSPGTRRLESRRALAPEVFPLQLPFQAKCLFAASLAVLIPLAGCKPVGPNYSRPTYTAPPNYKETGASTVVIPPPNPQGGGWQPATPSDGMLKGKWWEVYQDPQLNQLEERIAGYNQGLRQALETYLAAQDQVKAARSALYPTLSVGPTVTHEKTSANRPLVTPTTATNYNDLVFAGGGSWEPDFWGRIRRTVEAAHENAQASAADMANVNLSLQAAMATDYFQLRGLDAQTKLLQQTITDLEHQLDLTERRLKGGVATEADVALAQTQLETTRAQLVDVGVARAQYEHAVGTIADYKLPAFSIPFSPLDLQLPKIPLGVPSQLLERRPDIAAAERRTAAANAQIGIAVSAFYPTINLTGQGGFESTHGGTWIQGPSALWSLGASATELLFDAGQRRALTDQAKHTYEAQVSGYKGVIFLAFEDVEDQLSGLRILEQEASAEQRAVDSAQHSYDISDQRYKGGVTSYLEVLTAEATLIQNQQTAISLETRQFVDSVGLVRSLGGGWDTSQLPK